MLLLHLRFGSGCASRDDKNTSQNMASNTILSYSLLLNHMVHSGSKMHCIVFSKIGPILFASIQWKKVGNVHKA
jgi:hypothetical protein